ncbi:hypothetical protein MLD38_022239 [Melastoma candidum]|uniref:Uncharacterized protein n=1 Tax=Melastoma candidum TaxID=119954 RepID=A0ACB9QLM2_9MYRT|nr:hypothetical protein MLD38_022239 [Melastoma candidum]
MMAASSGNSSSSAATPSQPYSGSEGDARNSSGGLVDQRKRRRMESNRESARRSRMRKQKHLDDLTTQILHLNKENGQILSRIDSATRNLLAVEADNSVLKAQLVELGQRLQSLDEILDFICSISFNGRSGVDESNDVGGFGFDGLAMSHADVGYAQQQLIMGTGAGDVFGC